MKHFRSQKYTFSIKNISEVYINNIIKYEGLNYYSNFPNTSNPFFYRGGNYNDGTIAGAFSFSYDNGNPNGNHGFRPVLVSLRYKEKKIKNLT